MPNQTRWLASAFLCTCLVTGCGGGGESGSGLPGSTEVRDLTGSELAALCAYLVGLAGPDRTISCEDETTLMVDGATQDECVMGWSEFFPRVPNCYITVDELEACVEVVRVEQVRDAHIAGRCRCDAR
jgi:hypothetical protein